MLIWNLNIDETPRVRIVKDANGKEKTVACKEHRPMKPLAFAWKDSTDKYQQYSEKIKSRKQRISALKAEIDNLMAEQEKEAQLMAEKFIVQYREYIKKYHDRALYAKARLYDSMVPEE